MRQLGISIEELKDVEEVIIKTKERKIIFRNPTVTIMKSPEGELFQIVGKYDIESTSSEISFSEEDLQIVMEKANVSRDKAIEALKKTGGNPAEAIMLLLSDED